MKKGLVEIVFVLDKSGSMLRVLNDTIGGFNSFLREQKKLGGEANFTLVQFDHEYEVVHDGINIQDVPELNVNTYVPRGWTALLDAIGVTVNTVMSRLLKTPEDEKPEKVVIAILTDGHENKSSEYKKEAIINMIEQTKETGWEFIFLGADEKSLEEAKDIGIPASNAVRYGTAGQSCGLGIQHAYKSITHTVSGFRSPLSDKKN